MDICEHFMLNIQTLFKFYLVDNFTLWCAIIIIFLFYFLVNILITCTQLLKLGIGTDFQWI